MPKCKSIYPNCIWILPPEWHGLTIYSALLTKVYCNYATDIVRVCVTAIYLRLPNRMSITNPTSKFASAPKPWAALTNTCTTTLSAFRIRCWMNVSLMSLSASPRIFSTILSMKNRMMIPIIPTPIYLLSTPMTQPISLKF